MPCFDGTGPLGRGEMTGRGKGWCITEIKSDKTEFFSHNTDPHVLKTAAPFRRGHRGNCMRHFFQATVSHQEYFTEHSPKEETSQ